MKKIINEQNYNGYIHYVETNLFGLSSFRILKFRILSCLKSLLYIEKIGNLFIIEEGSVFVKKASEIQKYLLAKLED